MVAIPFEAGGEAGNQFDYARLEIVYHQSFIDFSASSSVENASFFATFPEVNR